ncbi:MAG: phosphonate C-P lyase system protein PhnH [Maritimibacter sp.]|uniref:phosphonate C-P lyase system protein PhnH n=1 Tax=Maritimibacter sp. TaxID=2003363 RepID=UPI001E109665|nr:phosphonate C-P lyase system protein PhnH [Maritimibacter sp.]MBL6428523.1 phosphonate C-P lyase system protein PhnH [Maritimibacter sp.]
MLNDALSGDFADAPREAARAFRAVLDAMARPGKIVDIVGGAAPAPISPAAATLMLTLCDGETPLYLAPSYDGAAISQWIAFHIGAPIVERGQAMFALGSWAALAPQTDFAIGTPEYPDRSATLIVEVDALTTESARLTGPGIESEAHLSLPETGFFARNAALFPLGVDCLFTCGSSLAALPRSTRVEDR